MDQEEKGHCWGSSLSSLKSSLIIKLNNHFKRLLANWALTAPHSRGTTTLPNSYWKEQKILSLPKLGNPETNYRSAWLVAPMLWSWL